MSEIEVFHDESLTDSSDPPAAVQSTSAPQDNSTEPAAAIRGRRPSHTTAANASKRRSPRPGCRSPQPPPSSSFHRTTARNPAQRKASLRLHKPPHQNKHASVSGIQLHAASDQRTPPLPMARSSATHGQPYSINASPGARLPPPPLFPPPLSVHQALSGSNLPQSSTQTPAIPPLFHAVSSVPGAPFSLSTASPLPIPPNTLALEPPPVANSIRSQILSEIQNIGTGGGSTPHPSTSLFRTDIPLNHPLKPLLEASLNSILQAVSPRTLQSYLTAWKSFKTFHSTYNLPFPTFSLLAITSFISHLNINKKLQTSSIKGYLSGLQFFHKLLYGSPSAHIANSQTSLLIKGIQKTNPTRPDSRQPITLKILTKCISTLRRGYHSIHTARTLDAMFILAFFGFLRCSELAISSSFDPAIHPTISDLAVLDDETISYTIKQSKTDQTKKGHFIYIFNLQSPILPYQTLLAFLHLRKSQSKLPSDPLFTDDSNRPVTRFWFQKHLKAVLHLSDTPAGNFSSHWFRIGAATTAAHKGLSQQQIQELGRWSSEAFKSYIRSDRSHIKEAHQTLIGHPL